MNITRNNRPGKEKNKIFLIPDEKSLIKIELTGEEAKYIRHFFDVTDKKMAIINRYQGILIIHKYDKDQPVWKLLEFLRKAGNDTSKFLNEQKIASASVSDIGDNPDRLLAFGEGLYLGNYQFLDFFTDKEKRKNSLADLNIVSELFDEAYLNKFIKTCEAVGIARDFVNIPHSRQTAEKFANQIEALGKKSGLKVETLNKRKIENLKMGGILAVNRGSIDPPAFSIIEWNPKNKLNSKPIVLVGKGVVYDTGGVSLKTSAGMETMKCDMAGGAAVAATLSAIAKLKIPVHVVGLIPISDNRPGENAYVPGDVITLHNGVTVEVLNTDAEGRLLLGDALSFAAKYKPDLVIDLATLTGAAVAAIGTFGSVMMGTAEQKTMELLKTAGESVYERVAEFPFWEEYEELIKSDIADIKNLGGPYGGAITAGKFLQKFISYPWIHLDIAGPAFLNTQDSYRGKGGTGTGVRLLLEFISNYYSSKS